jgi:hypothetical protein
LTEHVDFESGLAASLGEISVFGTNHNRPPLCWIQIANEKQRAVLHATHRCGAFYEDYGLACVRFHFGAMNLKKSSDAFIASTP